MPKVLRIINRFNLGGPTYNASYLTKYLSDDFETLLIGGRKEESEGDSIFITEKLGLKPLIIDDMKRSINFINDIRAYHRIKSIIKKHKPDIVHTHASKSGALGRLAAKNSGVPVIVHTFHGHIFDAYFNKISSCFFRITERWLAKKTDCIIVLSENQKNDLAVKYKICPEEKMRIIPLGFDLSRFREDQQNKRKAFRDKYLLDENEISIGIIGRLAPIKNHSFFIKAVRELFSRTRKKVKVFIIGDGEEKDNILSLLSENKLEYMISGKENRKAQVILTSWIKDIDVALAGLDIVSLCSLNEGTPVSLIEAQAAGKAIVSTNVGGIENMVIPNETALLSANNDLQGFVKNLIFLVENDEARNRLSEKGWPFVKERFHYTRLIEDTKNLYLQLLKNY